MVTARSGQPFEATLEGVPTGLVGQVALTVDDNTGTAAIARSTAGIVELSSGTDPGAGVYRAARAAAPIVEASTEYTLTWDLGDPAAANTTFTDQLVVLPALAFTALPSNPEVAALLRARTKDIYGKELGEFTQNTRVTDVQCAHLIGQAASEIGDAIGGDPADGGQRDSARAICALGAAMLVELTYYPEQVQAGQSPYAQYERMYERRLKRLIEAVAESGVGGGGDSVGGAGPLPIHMFPPPPYDEDYDYRDLRRVY